MHILILEESANNPELSSALKTTDREVVWERAETETEYLAALERRPDAVLAAHGVPQLNVPDALRLLQQRSPNIPFFVVGDAIGEDQAMACLKQGAAGVIRKDRLNGLAKAALRAPDACRPRRECHQDDAGLAARAAGGRNGEERFRQIAEELQTNLLAFATDFAPRATALQDRLSQKEAVLQAAAAALEEATRKLTQAHRFEAEIISTVAHEIRAPLSNIKLFLDLLESGKPEKRTQYMTTLQREVRFLVDLIEDMLQFASLDLGRRDPYLQPTDAGQVMMCLADDRRELARQKGLDLEACPIFNIPPVMADARMLTEVMSNLLANAINYTPAGGTISLQGEVHHQEGRPWVALMVSDTGPGIAPEDLPRIFERFYRGEAARRSQVPGTGLGLAICDEIVKRHGGRLTVQSTVGQGSTFTVWLPALMPEGIGTFDAQDQRGAF